MGDAAEGTIMPSPVELDCGESSAFPSDSRKGRSGNYVHGQKHEELRQTIAEAQAQGKSLREEIEATSQLYMILNGVSTSEREKLEERIEKLERANSKLRAH